MGGLLTGSIVALVTPMFDDGSIDELSLRRLVDWHVEQGTNAIVAMGTTGESATLTDDEWLRVVQIVVEQAAARIPVIAGTGSSSTAKAIKLTQAVEKFAIAATLCVTPYYNRPSQEGLYQHFAAIAAAATKPVLLYNVPGRTGCDLLPETVIRLANVPRIAGIKEATGKLDRLQTIKVAVSADFLLLSGDDASACDFMLQGGKGVISVTSNVAPKAMAAMCKAAVAGDAALAHKLDASLQGLHETLFVEPSPTPAKWAVAQLHGCSAHLRLPLLPLTAANQPHVRAAMTAAGVL
ncbi:4-hydroxy-tetrahydrodipicolinate synthase [Permianibacter sp. IMCC34836]|uniref:4-hydroxy-tetrahydrodipicolinate synthase n=1 Tax=Permianibacter fluminis TaxID=2738515 RepID=UPI001557654A|nr:4-hydroxy-tetrahydrodipicolinate synthase [Permianibacter fluminis]NQD38325.1 4-hydroxy-tetrahydrodipicolinate synthase [Permianibacter fluminis]